MADHGQLPSSLARERLLECLAPLRSVEALELAIEVLLALVALAPEDPDRARWLDEARVLANDPSIILMDEPFGALDAITRDRLQDELLRIWRATGKTILFITHSVDEAVYLGSRVLVMSPRPGQIVLDEEVGFSRTPTDSTTDVRHSDEFVEVARRVGAELAIASSRRTAAPDQ